MMNRKMKRTMIGYKKIKECGLFVAKFSVD